MTNVAEADLTHARRLVANCERDLGYALQTNIIDLICDNTDWTFERCEAVGNVIYKEKGIKRD